MLPKGKYNNLTLKTWSHRWNWSSRKVINKLST